MDSSLEKPNEKNKKQKNKTKQKTCIDTTIWHLSVKILKLSSGMLPELSIPLPPLPRQKGTNYFHHLFRSPSQGEKITTILRMDQTQTETNQKEHSVHETKLMQVANKVHHHHHLVLSGKYEKITNLRPRNRRNFRNYAR